MQIYYGQVRFQKQYRALAVHYVQYALEYSIESRPYCLIVSVPTPPLPLTKWPRKGWADSLVLTIPNNSGQSDRCMVTCLPKSRAKLVGDESRALFSSIIDLWFNFLSPTTGDSEAILMYTRGDVFVSLPTGAGKSVLYGASLASCSTC